MITLTRESISRRAAQNGDEQDAFSRSARRTLCALNRAGIVHNTKMRAARRTRRESRQALRLAGNWAECSFRAAARGDFEAVLDAYDMLSI